MSKRFVVSSVDQGFFLKVFCRLQLEGTESRSNTLNLSRQEIP